MVVVDSTINASVVRIVYACYIIFLSLSISFTCFSDEYTWKSKTEPIDHKCVTNKEVGIDQALYGDVHKLTIFYLAIMMSFLTHISNIPNTAHPSSDLPINDRKGSIKYVFYKDLSTESQTLEKKFYFFGTQSYDTSFLAPVQFANVNTTITINLKTSNVLINFAFLRLIYILCVL